MRTCDIDGCEKRHYAKGLCNKHWTRQHFGKDPQADPHPTNRVYDDGASWCLELLARDKSVRAVARISAEDVSRVRTLRWTMGTKYVYAYVRGSGSKNRKHVLLHRFLTDCPPGLEVDHKNGDGLDCRRENLHIVTNAINQENLGLDARNKTGYRGVYFDKERGGYCGYAYKTENGVRRRLFAGPFDTVEKAASAAKAFRETLYTNVFEERSSDNGMYVNLV